jgi:hypothetical protein
VAEGWPDAPPGERAHRHPPERQSRDPGGGDERAVEGRNPQTIFCLNATGLVPCCELQSAMVPGLGLAILWRSQSSTTVIDTVPVLVKRGGKQFMAKHTEKAPTAFVSYSWDSPDHKAWVREFASKLVKNGVDVILDQWHLGPGESVTQFMETSIEKAEFVLVVCSPMYAHKANSRKGGVGYEQQIISSQMAQGLKQKRFVPILRRGSLRPGRNAALPTHLSGLYAVDLRKDVGSDEGFEDLVRAIFLEPRHRPPPLGEGPIFARPLQRRKPRLKSKAVRLPDEAVDGYSLRSGVARAELHPKTFHIPSAARRARVRKGDWVKLIFEYPGDWAQEYGDMNGERMWVKVVGEKTPYLVGRLDNQPLAQDDGGWPLTWKDRVLFLPEHIIDIERPSRGPD